MRAREKGTDSSMNPATTRSWVARDKATLSLEGEGNDTLHGGAGNGDWLEPGTGLDSPDGGLGQGDVAAYVGADGPVVVSLQAGTATGSGTDSLTRLEDIFGSPFNDTLTGNARPNSLTDGWRGRSGTDTIFGLGGDDLVEGGKGNDALDGGLGTDSLYGEGGDDSLDGGDGDDFLDGGNGTDMCTNGECPEL
jgi:Ca2+-binding RTX toxin-like protein